MTVQMPGAARLTMAGANQKNAATTGAAPTSPSGAARPAKYPRQKPRTPTSSNACRGSPVK
jgi:hypothetical protein